ncbi:MAG: isopentenyl-diphosphate Delta-isomerase [Candidatus Methanofastidiosia archaeon]
MVKDETLLLVDKKDNVIGKEMKEKCHIKGLLHRAFMVMVFNDKGQLLLTRRSEKKRLWPGFWDGSVSSHVHEGESYEDSGRKRLGEELGVEFEVNYLFKFYYKVPYKNIGFEHEICAVLLAKVRSEISPNPDEISSFRYLGIEDFKRDIEISKEVYCPWLLIGFERLMKEHKESFEGFLLG